MAIIFITIKMEDELKRKRPDRALALKRQKLLNNHVIKATVSGVSKES